MHYEVSYKDMDPTEADEKAIRDIVDYLDGREQLFGDLVQLATCVEHEIPCESSDGKARVQPFHSLNMTFGFAGIQGFPFHAFCRRYCPNKYAEWMASGD